METDIRPDFETLDDCPIAYVTVTVDNVVPTIVKRNDKFLYSIPATTAVIKALKEYNTGGVVDALKFSATIKTLRNQLRAARNGR